MSSISRRILGFGFISALATVAFPALAAEPLPDSVKVGGFAIGCQAWTFNKFTVFEAIEKTRESGAKVIEFFPGQKLSKEQPDVKITGRQFITIPTSTMQGMRLHGNIGPTLGLLKTVMDSGQGWGEVETTDKPLLSGLMT